MIKKAPLILLFTFISIPILIFSQKECKVLLPAISKSYDGKCKKGLAHGKGMATGIDTYTGRFHKGLPDGNGTYTWSSGAEYTGEWKSGKREGTGIYKFKYNGKDSIQEGIWKNDNFEGPMLPPPRILESQNVEQYRIQKIGDNEESIGVENKVTVELYMNGIINSSVENLSVVSSTGLSYNRGDAIVYNNIVFPVTVKVTYLTWNKVHTYQYNVVFEVEIYEPGSWLIRLTN